MQSTFQKILPKLFAHEGGYVNHPRDPGGATNFGITHRTLAKWRKKRVTRGDVRRMTRKEAAKIYKAWYWDKVRCDDLPAGVDYSVFDFGVNAGPRRSIKTLQRAVGTAADGVIGPMTLAAANKRSSTKTVKNFANRRLAFYKRLRHWRTFGRGWSRRVREVLNTSLSLVED